MPPEDEYWLDDSAGRLVRPYAVSEGRTSPAHKLDLLSMVMVTGSASVPGVGPDHAQVLAICGHPASVAEIAARMQLPAAVTKILVSDLMDAGAVITRMPGDGGVDPRKDLTLLQAVLNGLRAL